MIALKAMTSVLATTLSRHKPSLVNASVGFATFAAGDVLAQGTCLPPEVLLDQRSEADLSAIKTTSWLGSLSDRTRGVDFERSAKVGLLGIALNGVALGAWYKVLDKYLGSSRTNMKSVLSKILADQMCYAPFTITSFVTYAAVLNGGGVKKTWEEARHNMSETFVSTWLMDWKIWPAANLVMFRFIPSSYRPSCASLVCVAWQTYLSSVSFDPHAPPTAATTTAITTATDHITSAVQVKGGGYEGIQPGSSPVSVKASLPQPDMHQQRRHFNQRRMTSRYAYFGPRKKSASASVEGNGAIAGGKDTRASDIVRRSIGEGMADEAEVLTGKDAGGEKTCKEL